MQSQLRPMHRGPNRGGFTLMEVLVAIGVFALGFIAVVAMLPVGAVIQRETVDEIYADQVAASAQAALRARPFHSVQLDRAVLGTDSVAHIKVQKIPNAMLQAIWPLKDRSFPTTIADPTERRFFWVPVVRRHALPETDPSYVPISAEQWTVYVLVLRRTGNDYAADKSAEDWATNEEALGGTEINRKVPGARKYGASPAGAPAKVFNTAAPADPGGFVLDSGGTIWHVVGGGSGSIEIDGFIFPDPDTGATPDAIWAGERAGGSGAASVVRIVEAPDAVENY